MPITFDQYIVNPMQKAGRVLSARMREAQRAEYKRKFDNVLLRENGKINFYQYKDDKNNVYWCHIKVPSEVVKNFYYDVVLKFWADTSIINLGRELNHYWVQFYSNDPAYVFTYAYVFNKNQLFPRELASKMSKKALKEAANITNPSNQVGYVKSLVFAYLFMEQRGLFHKVTWMTAPKIDFEQLLGRIMPADEKVALRIEEDKKLDKRKKIAVDAETARRIDHMHNLSDEAKSRIVATTNKSPTVKKTKAVNATKLTGRTRKSKFV